MNTTVRRGINWVQEAMNLLENGYTNERYAVLSARWQARRGERAQRAQAVLAELMRMEQAVRAALADRQEQLDFFFRPLTQNGLDNAVLLLSWRCYGGYESLEDARQKLLSRTEQQRAEDFLKALQNVEYVDAVGGVAQLFRELVECGLTGEQKQTVGQMFFHYEEYLNRLLELLDRAIAAMQPWQAFFDAEAEACADYWQAALAETDILTWLNQRFQLALDESPNGCEMIPSVTGCQSLALAWDPQSARYVLRMGVLLDVSGEEPEQDPAALCEAMKLLGDRSKMDILRILKEQRAYGSELARKLGLTTPTISHHMQALIDCNLVGLEKVNNRVYYQLNRRRLEEILEELRGALLD